jgi:predicted N-formylglutamate amidohydrolase
VSDEDHAKHIAWDIGAKRIGRQLEDRRLTGKIFGDAIAQSLVALQQSKSRIEDVQWQL